MDPGMESPSETFRLHGGGGLVVLDDHGIHHPKGARGGALVFTPYEDVTHLACSERALWVGAKRSVYVLPRRDFVQEHAPERLFRTIQEHIEALPNGDDRMRAMAILESRGRGDPRTPATWGLVAVCLVGFALQLLGGQQVYDVGYYNALLVETGDWWRVVTANLLHAYPKVPVHLVLNLLGLIALGTLAERPLGSGRTLWVMGASGVAAMAASEFGLTESVEVVGVSGVVFGLLGAVTWLELCHGDTLPAWWRVPRRGLYTMLGVSALLGLLPMIAGAAHLGGFVAGAAAASLRWRSPVLAPRPWMRLAGGSVVAATLVAVFAAAIEIGGKGDYPERLTHRIASLPGVSPMQLNNRAWFIAIDEESSPELLAAALRMAERAVEETDRKEPAHLDTLAELQFVLGDAEAAVATIGEAIVQDPDERYYQEQLERFLGERDERPDPPGTPREEAEMDPGLEV